MARPAASVPSIMQPSTARSASRSCGGTYAAPVWAAGAADIMSVMAIPRAAWACGTGGARLARGPRVPVVRSAVRRSPGGVGLVLARQHLQVLPHRPLVAQTAQTRGRMVGHDQLGAFEAINVSAQPRDGALHAHQQLGGE